MRSAEVRWGRGGKRGRRRGWRLRRGCRWPLSGIRSISKGKGRNTLCRGTLGRRRKKREKKGMEIEERMQMASLRHKINQQRQREEHALQRYVGEEEEKEGEEGDGD